MAVPSYLNVNAEERSAFIESEEWKARLARLEASHPRCVVVLTKTFCCGLMLPVELKGDLLERWICASYFYTSGYCPDCEKNAPAAQWSLTHYDDAQVIWNGHAIQPHLDEDAESFLH